MQKGNLVVAIYSPPEYYPPTLNAIEYLSGEYKNIRVVYRNYDGEFDWKYPSNVTLVPIGKSITVRAAEVVSTFRKIFFFLQYSLALLSELRKSKPHTLLIYDYLPILSIRMIWPFIKKPAVIWYHNHDVGEEKFLRKGSISWFAWKSEKWIFPKLSIFSLPSLDRKPFFPINLLKGRFFFIPNFPSKKIFERYPKRARTLSDEVKILYQGSIGSLHGIEEIIVLMKQEVAGKKLRLVLKGFISPEYQQSLEDLASLHSVTDKLSFLPPTSYSKVIENSLTCHIGIGIHRKDDIMNKTLGTSSNKIYEYAASGMPVLLYDNQQFRSNLEKYDWAFFTDCSEASLKDCLEKIMQDYENLSMHARADFEEELNFEKNFKPVCSFLN